MIELAALFVLGFFLGYLQWSKDRAVNSLLAEWSAERKAWAQERQELNTRIQHPGVFIAPQREGEDLQEATPEEPDQIDLVGEIVNGNGEG